MKNMTEKDRVDWLRRHFDVRHKALYWPCWFFLPHGTDTDKKRLLSQKAHGIIWHDRELIRSECPEQSRW